MNLRTGVGRIPTAAALASALVVLATGVPAVAQDAPKTRKVAAGPQYGANAFHRMMLGASYRALWTTPIEVEVLDLAAEAGGLTPARRVGGQQTKGLAFSDRSGRSYTFRSLDKDPSNIPPRSRRHVRRAAGTGPDGVAAPGSVRRAPSGFCPRSIRRGLYNLLPRQWEDRWHW
jgi:hypothetical protein